MTMFNNDLLTVLVVSLSGRASGPVSDQSPLKRSLLTGSGDNRSLFPVTALILSQGVTFFIDFFSSRGLLS